MEDTLMTERGRGKTGRPTKYSPEIAGEICQALSCSDSGIDEVCKRAGITRSTFYLWRHQYPDFSDSVSRAMELHYEIMGEALVEHADEDVIQGDRSDSARVQLRKLQNETRRWVLGKRLPHLYGDRLAVSAEIEFDIPDLRPPSMLETDPKPALPAGDTKAPEGSNHDSASTAEQMAN